MASDEGERKLAAILSADVVGYSKLMADDERATVNTLKEYRLAIARVIERHKGRVVNFPGDNILADFPSAVEAVQGAVEIQKVLEGRNLELVADRRMEFRIGVNLGDVIEEADGTIYGDGVNIAARMEALAEAGGICISSSIYDAIEGKLDFGFDFLGEQQVKNISKPVRVYRVRAEPGAELAKPASGKGARIGLIAAAAVVVVAIGGITVWQVTRTPESAPSVASEETPALKVAEADVASVKPALPDKPSIAVLPFDNLSDDPGQDYFVDGLTEEIIATLARFPDLRVIARNSTFRYKGQAVDVRAVGEELDVRYLVEGSVRRAVDTIRVTAQLIEAETRSHLWSETYDRELTAETVFAIQDEIATAIANTLADTYGVLRQEGLAATRRKPPGTLSSYECVLLAMEWLRIFSRETHERARDCLERAVENDPDYATAWSNLAMIYVYGDNLGYDSRPGLLDRALKAAHRAVELAPGDPLAHWKLAWTHFFRGELDAFKAEVNRATEDASKGASFLGNAGLFLAYAGEWDRGLALIEEAKAFDPFYPGGYHFGEFFDNYRKGAYEAALVSAQKTNLPDYVWAQALIAAAYGQLGRADEAQPTVKRILELDPDFEATARAKRWRWFRYQEDLLDHFMEGLRKAGLDIPDGPPAAD